MGGAGGDKGKSQQKVLVFASGIRKVFGHRFNWGRGGQGGVPREGEEGLQWGTCRLGVTHRGHSSHLPLKPSFSPASPRTEAGCFWWLWQPL